MSNRVLDPALLRELAGKPKRRRKKRDRDLEVCRADSFRLVTEPVTIRLAFPPMLNHYYRACVIGGHVSFYIDAEGREYRDHVIEEWEKQAGPVTFEGLLAIHLDIVFPDARERDVDGCFKALFDGLEHAGAFRNDSRVKRVIADQSVIQAPGWVDVTLGPKPGVDRQKSLFDTQW